MRHLLRFLNPLAFLLLEGESGTPSGGGTTPAATPTTGTTPSSGAVTPPASGTGTETPAAGSTPAGKSADELGDGNWRVMRERLTAAETKAALLGNLDGLDEAQLPVAWKQYRAMSTEITTLGTELGYTKEELDAAVAADPVFALSELRKAKAEAAAKGAPKPGESAEDFAKRIKEEVATQIKPFTEHTNKQISDAVEAKVATEFQKSYEAVLPNTPPEVQSLVRDYVDEYLIANTNLIVAMKARGDYSSIDNIVRTVAGRLTDVFQKWTAHESTRTGGRTTPASSTPLPNGAARTSKFTLDDLINDPGILGPQYK